MSAALEAVEQVAKEPPPQEIDQLVFVFVITALLLLWALLEDSSDDYDD